MAKCIVIDHPNIFPGWGCCKCKTYNSNLYEECKYCSHKRCDEPKETEPNGGLSIDKKDLN